MKKTFRFYFALFFAKCTALLLKLIGRKGTSMPGSWAIILCPDFIGRITKPKKIIGITGTNGKTTVANMLEDILTQNNIPFFCNRSGSNVNTGIASALIANSNLLGHPKQDLAVLELDERSAPKLYPYLQPDILICTNIFRDSCKRNAHAEFILSILNQEIPKGTKLVLNGDDPLCSSICPENDRVYFSIDHLDTDKTVCENIVNDAPICPNCSGPLTHDVVRYHHIGRAHCTRCGYRSPKADYLATDIDLNAMTMTVKSGETQSTYSLPNSSTINIYNTLAVISGLLEFGLTPEQIRVPLQTLHISETRYMETETPNGKKIILHLAKAQNPIACSRAFENVRNAPGRKSVLLLLDDRHDAMHTVESKAWLYDTDFEFLNDDSIVQLILVGARHYDTYLRALLADIPENRITHMRNERDAVSALDAHADTIFILYEIHSISLSEEIRQSILDSAWAKDEKPAGD